MPTIADQNRAIWRASAHNARQAAYANVFEAVKWGAAMALPFGDLWLFYKGVELGVAQGGPFLDVIKKIYNGASTYLGDAAAIIQGTAPTPVNAPGVIPPIPPSFDPRGKM